MKPPKTLYKLTRPELTTHNGCQWTVGEWKETSGEGDLCGSGWLHCYEHPLLAALHNPVHANYGPAILWRCEAGGVWKREGQLKCGVTRLRLVREVPLPDITIAQRVRYAIYAADCHQTGSIQEWAKKWLSGEDRTKKAAAAAAAAATQAAAAAARAAWSAAWAWAWSSGAWAAEAVARVTPTNLNLLRLARRAILDESKLWI